MSWNYRVIVGADGQYGIHEVYYAEDGKTISSWTESPIAPGGESVKELRSDLGAMLHSFSKPILKEVNGKLVPAGEKG